MRLRTGLTLIALTLVTLWPLLHAGFVYWDDHALFLNDRDVAAFDLTRLLTDLRVGGFFPLTRLSLALDHALFGYNAAIEHTINLVLHMVNVGLAYRVARRVFSMGEVSAGVAAALFAVHPANVETVAWISGGRKDLLCAMFFLTAVTARSEVATITAGLAALLAKATAVSLGPWLWLSRRRRAALLLGLPTLTALLLELRAQRTVLHVASGEGGLSLARAARSLTMSTARALLPHDLAIYYDPAVVSFHLVDFIALAGFAGVVITGAKDPCRRRALLWFGLLLLPTCKLVPFGQDSVFNDRYLYLPGLGLIAAVVMTVERAWAARAWRATLALIPIAAAAALAHGQTRVWRDQERLWLNVERTYPGSRKVAGNLSLYYINENRLAEAEPFARRAVLEDPLNAEARSNLGVLLTRLGRTRDARDVYLAALRLHLGDPRLLNNLGYVYLDLEKFDDAADAFTTALTAAPDFANAREGLRRARAR